MENKFTTRTALILGEDGIKKLQNSHVLVIGVGGVGSFCAEALVRAGVGNITIVDYAKVEVTDINRQLPGLTSTLGKDKVEVVKERLLDINNNLNINAIKATFNHETSDEMYKKKYTNNKLYGNGKQIGSYKNRSKRYIKNSYMPTSKSD